VKRTRGAGEKTQSSRTKGAPRRKSREADDAERDESKGASWNRDLSIPLASVRNRWGKRI